MIILPGQYRKMDKQKLLLCIIPIILLIIGTDEMVDIYDGRSQIRAKANIIRLVLWPLFRYHVSNIFIPPATNKIKASWVI